MLENKSKRELIEIIYEKDAELEQLRADKLKVKQLISDLERQKQVMTGLINSLRDGRAEILNIFKKIEKNVAKIN